MTGAGFGLKNADLFLQESCVCLLGNGQKAAVRTAMLRNTSAGTAFTSNTSFPLSVAVNRTLACAPCNLVKAAQVSGIEPDTGSEAPLFNPRTQAWAERFRWGKDRQMLIG